MNKENKKEDVYFKKDCFNEISFFEIQINAETRNYKMYADETMQNMLDIKNSEVLPEIVFKIWYDKIQESYKTYIQKAIKKLSSKADKSIELNYIFNHSLKGDIIARACLTLDYIKDSTIFIKGYQENITDVLKMNTVGFKYNREVLKYNYISKNAYLLTEGQFLDINHVNINNLPHLFISNEIVHKSFKDAFLKIFEEDLLKSDYIEVDIKLKNKEENYIWCSLKITKDNYKNSKLFTILIENINDIKELEIAYLKETKFYKAMLQDTIAYSEINLTKDIFLKGGGIFSEYNKYASKYHYSEIFTKFPLIDIFIEDEKIYNESLNINNLIENYNKGLVITKFEFRKNAPNEDFIWLEFTINTFKEMYSENILALFYIKNIDSRKKQELILEQETKMEPLTGLYNKKYFKIEIENMLKDCLESDLFTFIIFDIDNFKDINDTFGHSFGDEVLIFCSELLKNVFVKNALISRFGGDEFVVFLKNFSKKEVEDCIQKFFTGLKNFEKTELSFSIGAILYSKLSYIEYLTLADKALYKAKNDGKNRFVWISDRALKEALDTNFYTTIRIKPKKLKESDKKISYNKDLFLEEGEIAYLADLDTYELLDVNKAFCKALNKTKKECIGKKCYEILYDRKTPCSLCKKVFFNYEEFFAWTNFNKKLNNEYLVKNKLIEYKNKPAIISFSSLLPKTYNFNKQDDKKSLFLEFIDELNSNPKNNIFEHLFESLLFFYESEFCLLIEENKKIDEEWKQIYCLSKNTKKIDINTYKISTFNKKITMPLFLSTTEEILIYSYELFKFTFENNIFNLLIIPIYFKDKFNGYIISVNLSKNITDLDYSKIISNFILQEIIKIKLQSEVSYYMIYDKLTGIRNREGFRKYELSYDKDEIDSVGVFCFQINELDNINHNFNIETGDKALRQVANILKNVFKKKNCFRISGNEFLVLLQNIPYNVFLDKVALFKDKIEKLNLSITKGEFWSDTEKELTTVVNNAIIIRKNKNLRPNDRDIDIANKRNMILTELMASIKNGEFEVFLQPKFYIKDNSFFGAEALIRRKNKVNDGYIAPDKFIPLFENNYLIQYIDLFVFEQAYIILQNLQEDNVEIFPISINFSKRTIMQSNIIEMVKKIKQKYAIKEKYIEIEVTESIEEIEKQKIIEVIKTLKKLGYKIFLDDFGIKYSNLSILSEASFSGLKLDKSMIKNIGFKNTNEIIIKNIIAMCNEMGLVTVAEGIETEEQKATLKEMQCEVGQGYLYSKPLPVSEFIKKYLY